MVASRAHLPRRGGVTARRKTAELTGVESPEPVRILVADDDPTMRLVLGRWITRELKAVVVEAENGLQALEILAARPIDMVVSDINMPLLDGIEFLSLVRGDPAYKELEFLIVSAVQVEARVHQAIALGVSDYLLKPLQYETVGSRLQQALQRVLKKREERQRQQAAGLPGILVADPDPNFCEFAQSALAGGFSCHIARTATEALLRMLRSQPDLVLLSPKLPGLAIEFLLQKIADLSKSRPARTFLLVDSPNAPVPRGVAGNLPYTFVPEELRSRVSALLYGTAGGGQGPGAWIPGLRPEILTALRQALGMMAGAEATETEAPAQAPAFEMLGQVGLEADSGEFSLSLRIDCCRALAQALVSRMLGVEEAGLDQEAEKSGIQEILNVIGGRVKNSCYDRKIPVTLGLPIVNIEQPAAGPEPALEWSQYFRWEGVHEFRFRFLMWGGAAPEATA